MPLWQAILLLVLGFFLLAKCTPWLVDGGVVIADRLKVPQLLIGLVLMAFATTAPEFAVSFLSALSGKPEMALGNAVGSVIVDDCVALAALGVFAAAPLVIARPRHIAVLGAMLLAIDAVAFALSADGLLDRWEGSVLLASFLVYLAYIIRDGKRNPPSDVATPHRSTPALLAMFLAGLLIVLGSAHVVVMGAVELSLAFGVPEAVVALTVVAVGTSIPEIATCVVSAHKGHGSLAVGTIIGADILNIAWIAGASAVANPLAVEQKVVYFMFPAMIFVVAFMLAGIVWKKKMTRLHGVLLFILYLVYMSLMFWLFPPSLAAH